MPCRLMEQLVFLQKKNRPNLNTFCHLNVLVNAKVATVSNINV